MGYTKEALKGVSWIWALRLLMRSVSFVRIAVIARILSPTLFGFYGIAALVLSFVEVFTESGINIFIIQEKEDLKKIISTAWVVSIARGFIIFFVIILSIPLISYFFRTQEANYLIFLISFVPLIRGFINPAIIKFQKDLLFKNELIFRGTIFTFESVMSVVFVYLLQDPAGIIYGLILGAIVEVILSFMFVRPTPIFSVDSIKLKRIISRGKWLTASGIFNYLYHNADDAVVGRVLGATSLGLYEMAYKISMLPITEIGETVSKVIFPVYTRISDDKERLKRAFSKTIIAVSICSIPVGIIFYVFAEQIIFIVLGEQWLGAVPIFKLLAIFGIIRTILNPVYSLFLSVKKQEYNTIITSASFLTMIVAIFPMINYYGLIGAGFAVIFGSICALPLSAYYLMRVFRRGE